MSFQTLQITIPKPISKTHDLIAIERHEWDQMRKQLGELAHALQVIAAGEREWRAGKTRTVKSLKELA